MKNIFMLLLLLLSIPVFDQGKKNNDSAADKIQANDWMETISEDPQMRQAMLTMILNEANGNLEEMTVLGETIMSNKEMNSVVSGMTQKSNQQNLDMEARGSTRDTIQKMKLSDYKIAPKK